MLLILDFDVDHILTANRIDDDIQMMNICSQIESEGILLFSYLYVLFYLVVDGCLNVQTVI